MNEDQKQKIIVSVKIVLFVGVIGSSLDSLRGYPISFLHLVNSLQEIYILKYIPINWTDKC